ncbi:hypothetical protein [uncultured Pedobacter sp.]|uniref:hypothetical protein n=1 Tax=uncultured Pedobacter sp. TaxID=246139 RepID=UPI0025F9DD02|nr:hypothetical protein [uncultured Pedobacter sp.]
MLIKKAILGLLFTCCTGYLASAQSYRNGNKEVKEFIIDTLNLDKVMFEMEQELRLTIAQKPEIKAQLKKYLIKRMQYHEFEYREPEEWRGRSNNWLFDFSRNLEKILDEDQIDCFWAMKPAYKNDNIWWNIFVFY